MHQIWDGLKHWIPIITDDYVWGWGPEFLLGIPLMVILLLGTGITLSFYTGFVQFRKFFDVPVMMDRNPGRARRPPRISSPAGFR